MAGASRKSITQMKALLSYLRKRATANGCEVVFPWFPEANPNTDALRLIRLTRLEPAGSKWINYPLAFVLWIMLSTWAAIRVWLDGSAITAKHFGVGRIRQLLQLLSLAWGRNVSPIEYYEFQYFKDDIRQRAEYYLPAVRQARTSAMMNEDKDAGRLNHKFEAFKNLTAAGIRNPAVLEVFYKDGTREFSSDIRELDQYIGRDFFVKPVNSYGGDGVARWLHDPVGKQYSDGERVVEETELWNVLTEEAKSKSAKYTDDTSRMLQELVANHPVLDALSRESLNTVRVVSLMFPHGDFELMYATLKMALDDSIEDTKHCVASDVDLQSGEVAAAGSADPGEDGYSHHPTTGARIAGVILPHWDDAIELIKRAHELYNNLPILGWDIAITPEGPSIIEANCGPKIGSVQAKSLSPLSQSRYADLFWAWQAQKTENSET